VNVLRMTVLKRLTTRSYSAQLFREFSFILAIAKVGACFLFKNVQSFLNRINKFF
jgi:hypothetical protein